MDHGHSGNGSRDASLAAFQWNDPFLLDEQ